VFRHDQHHAIPLDRRHHRERDPGVAAGGLDQGIARSDIPAGLGVPDHAVRRAVLDRTGRVVAFQFDQQGIVRSARQALQLYQRCIADHGFKRGEAHVSAVS
jgi:hypothetical protein